MEHINSGTNGEFFFIIIGLQAFLHNIIGGTME